MKNYAHLFWKLIAISSTELLDQRVCQHVDFFQQCLLLSGERYRVPRMKCIHPLPVSSFCTLSCQLHLSSISPQSLLLCSRRISWVSPSLFRALDCNYIFKSCLYTRFNSLESGRCVLFIFESSESLHSLHFKVRTK